MAARGLCTVAPGLRRLSPRVRLANVQADPMKERAQDVLTIADPLAPCHDVVDVRVFGVVFGLARADTGLLVQDYAPAGDPKGL